MYKLQNFLGDKYDRIRSIMEIEYGRVSNYVNMIGSANYPFPSVLQALDTPFSANPSEGRRGHRYFPLCDSIDSLEEESERLIQKLFQCNNYYCNVEPYSGTQANQIVYHAALQKGDTVLAMTPSSGGHVSHYFYIKEFYNLVEYSLGTDGLIDYDEIQRLCQQYKPKLLISGCSSYPRQIDYPRLSKICHKYETLLLADISHTAIYVMTGQHASPIGYADFITFTTHKTTRGIRGGVVLCIRQHQKAIDRAVFPIIQGAPKFTEILAKTIMFAELDNINLKEYVQQINVITSCFVDVFRSYGLSMLTDGTDMHIIVLDLSNTGITGSECESLLQEQHILVNRNSIPNDKLPASTASGIRLGTLGLASLGFTLQDAKAVAEIIAQTIVYGKTIRDAQEIMNHYSVIE